MNSLNIAGFLGGDPEVRVAPSGTAVTTFSVPVEQGWGDNKKTTWVECVLFGAKGTGNPHGLTEHLHKGRYVSVTGELVLEQWEHQGKQYAKCKCVTRDVGLGPKSQAKQDDGGQQDLSPSAQNAQEEGDWRDDDIPF